MFERGMINVLVGSESPYVGIVVNVTPDTLSIIYEDDCNDILRVSVCVIDISESSCDIFLSTEAERIW